MASLVKTGNVAHDTVCLAALIVYQNATANLTMNAAGQTAMNNAEIVFHRAVIASARANNCGVEASLSALKLLGVNN